MCLRVSETSVNSVFIHQSFYRFGVPGSWFLVPGSGFRVPGCGLRVRRWCGAKGGSRTPKAFRPPDPKSGASASSATLAFRDFIGTGNLEPGTWNLEPGTGNPAYQFNQ